MVWTSDPATALGKVRLLSREDVQNKSVLQDESMEAFLELEGRSIRLAAADALDYLANTQELLLRKLDLTGALSTDGPAVAADLRQLGINSPAELLGRDPYAMYDDLCRISGQRHDPCLLDTFIAAVRFMEGGPKKPWWKYTAERKKVLATRNRSEGHG